MSTDTIKELETILSARESRGIIKSGDVIYSAVMLILSRDRSGYDDGFKMLFIKRPDAEGDTFAGHMAFPGGKCEETDSSRLNTALRETQEEVGLDLRSKGRILGSLDDVNPITPSVNMYVVTPFVSQLLVEAELRTNGEVAETLWIPVSHLKDPAWREQNPIERNGIQLTDYVFMYEGHKIWGLTGRIVNQFLDLAGHLF